MPLALTWPLRSAGIGAGVGGSVSQRSAALAGSTAIRRSIATRKRRIIVPFGSLSDLQVLAASQGNEGSPGTKPAEARAAGQRGIGKEAVATLDRHCNPPRSERQFALSLARGPFRAVRMKVVGRAGVSQDWYP
jgi:hypothetical protein